LINELIRRGIFDDWYSGSRTLSIKGNNMPRHYYLPGRN
jgi:hypothetical protein